MIKLRCPQHPVAALAFSPDRRMLAIAGTDSTVRLRDVATGKQHGQAITGAGTDLQFSPDGSVVATGGIDTSVHLWDVATGKPHGQPVGVAGSFFRFSPDGKLLAAVDAGYTIRLWDVATGEPHGRALPGFRDDFSPASAVRRPRCCFAGACNAVPRC